MVVVGVAQLKAKLSEYLARVRGGEEVLITEHGRPVARIVSTTTDHERLADLERRGLVRVGSMKLPDGFLDEPLPKFEGGSLVDALIEERREGR